MDRVNLQLFSICRNDFLWETHTLTSLVNSVRMNPKIYHLGVDLQNMGQVRTICSYLKIKPHLQ